MQRRTLLLAVAATAAALAGLAQARDFSAGDLTVGAPWSRPAVQGGVGAGFLTITNDGAAADRLKSVSSPVAQRVEIHESMVMGGQAMMHPHPEGLTIAPGATATLKPGGWHLMLIGLKRPLKVGDRFPATLTFEKAGALQVEFTVQAGAQGGMTSGGGGHDHHR